MDGGNHQEAGRGGGEVADEGAENNIRKNT